jgi:hypothetical protein
MHPPEAFHPGQGPKRRLASVLRPGPTAILGPVPLPRPPLEGRQRSPLGLLRDWF